jgi:plasmid stability protein
MPDILIRDVPEATVVEIDKRASQHGISRSEFLRRWLDQGIRPAESVTVDDLCRLSRLASDLADPDVMRKAWS